MSADLLATAALCGLTPAQMTPLPGGNFSEVYAMDTATGWVKAFMAGRQERIENGQPMVGWPARMKAANDT